jgi:hypothetical protein
MKVNNLKISYNSNSELWIIFSPSGIILEEFQEKFDAIEWAKLQFDYTL